MVYSVHEKEVMQESQLNPILHPSTSDAKEHNRQQVSPPGAVVGCDSWLQSTMKSFDHGIVLSRVADGYHNALPRP